MPFLQYGDATLIGNHIPFGGRNVSFESYFLEILFLVSR